MLVIVRDCKGESVIEGEKVGAVLFVGSLGDYERVQTNEYKRTGGDGRRATAISNSNQNRDIKNEIKNEIKMSIKTIWTLASLSRFKIVNFGSDYQTNDRVTGLA